jgi:hypothetical protein
MTSTVRAELESSASCATKVEPLELRAAACAATSISLFDSSDDVQEICEDHCRNVFERKQLFLGIARIYLWMRKLFRRHQSPALDCSDRKQFQILHSMFPIPSMGAGPFIGLID